jgi:hypothetical protein
MSSITFEKSTLKRFYGDSSVDFAEILSEYLTNQDEIHLSLKRAFKEGLEPLQSSIHFHSSIFCYIGFPELTAFFLDFEEDCKKTADISTLSVQFNELLEKVRESAVIAKYEMEQLQENIYQ